MPPIKTIRRRKSWPKWARWYAVDGDDLAFVFAEEPTLRRDYTGMQYWMSHDGEWEWVTTRQRGECTRSLRKIAPAGRRG